MKKSNKSYLVVIALIGVLAVGGAISAYTGQNNGTVIENQVVEGDYLATSSDGESLGAFSGPDIYNDLNVYGHITTGSDKALATTSRDVTGFVLTYDDLNRYTWFNIVNGTDTDNLSWAMPATSTMMQILPRVGSSRTWTFHNSTTTAGTTFTLTAGAGMDLVGTANTADVIAGSSYMGVTCTQIPYISATNQNVTCSLLEHVAAD